MTKTIRAISARTDAEWPREHPLRAHVQVLSDNDLATHAAADRAFLICSNVGDDRLPPAADDADVSGVCATCGRAVIHRKSAPTLPLICFACWEAIAS